MFEPTGSQRDAASAIFNLPDYRVLNAGAMGNEGTPGKPTTRRYSPEEKARAVRLVRQLRK